MTTRSYRYLHLDVFTDRVFGGNQLAVFLDGRGLTTGTMQAIAKEMAFSESTFILPPEQPDTDVRMRIFTPGDELPMAGHPTVGSTFALARSGVIGPERDRFVFGLDIGPVPVSLTWRNGELIFVWMTQPNRPSATRWQTWRGRRRRWAFLRRRWRAPGCRCRSCRAAFRSCSCRSRRGVPWTAPRS